MGRRNTSNFDDLLLQKTKGLVCQVLDNLNCNGEIEHVQALSSRETIERWNNVTDMGFREVKEMQRARSTVTYEHFVENLDSQDQFVKDLAELLVGQTIRKAISRSLGDHAHKKCAREANPPLIQSERERQTELDMSEKVRHGVRRLARAVRRSDSWDSHRHLVSSPSSSSSPSSESDSTLMPLDVLPLEPVPQAPGSVLQGARRESGETTRRTRMRRNGGGRADATRAEASSRRAELMALRARLSQRRHTLSQEARARDAAPSLGQDLEERESGETQAAPASTSNADDRAASSLFHAARQGDETANLIHRFLTQPFPSEARVRNSRWRGGNWVSEGSDSALLDSMFGNADNEPSESPAVGAANAEGRPEEQRASSRVGEFEAFASSRRQSRRSIEPPRRDTNNESQEGAQGDETFFRALDSLFQADDTIEMVSREAEASERAREGEGRARRYELPALNELRPVVRLPSRTTREA